MESNALEKSMTLLAVTWRENFLKFCPPEENFFKANGDAMSDSQVDIVTCFGQWSRLGHMKIFMCRFQNVSYTFCREIEVIHENRSI